MSALGGQLGGGVHTGGQPGGRYQGLRGGNEEAGAGAGVLAWGQQPRE